MSFFVTKWQHLIGRSSHYEQLISMQDPELCSTEKISSLYDDETDHVRSSIRSRSQHRPTTCQIALIGSLLCNTLLILASLGYFNSLSDISFKTTAFAKLSYNSKHEILYKPVSTSADWNDADNFWMNRTWPNRGVVALDNTYAHKQGLLPSQPFVWDQSKSLYVINGFHLLHCLQIIYHELREFQQGTSSSMHSYPPSHVSHCLSALRAQVLCDADDTPLHFARDGSGAGEGQSRVCRDWSQLEAWASEHESCYRKIAPGNETIPEIERFKFCHKDSGYLPQVREYFGYDDDWVPEK